MDVSEKEDLEGERRYDLEGDGDSVFREEDKEQGVECSMKRSTNPNMSLTRTGSLLSGRNDIHGEE